jgi:energy-coupling factor transporter ATP-binding protein EcfA2
MAGDGQAIEARGMVKVCGGRRALDGFDLTVRRGRVFRFLGPNAKGKTTTIGILVTRVQPALSGLIDGSLSTLAPTFAVALATHRPLTALFTGVATALGAGVSMAFSEGLSDTGDLTGRGSPMLRGAISGGGTFAGGIFHTLPFLIPGYGAAITAAIAVVASELVILAWLRHKFFHTGFARSLLAITVGGAIIATLSSALELSPEAEDLTG